MIKIFSFFSVVSGRVPIQYYWDVPYSTPVDFHVPMKSFDGLNNFDEVWYSPSFLTHPDGYKMCISIRRSDSSSTSEVCAHLMAGEKDDLLQWPFCGTVIITLLSGLSREYNHILCDIRLESGRVWNGVRVKSGIASSSTTEAVSILNSLLRNQSLDGCAILRINVDVQSMEHPINDFDQEAPLIETKRLFEITEFSKLKKNNSEMISDPFESDSGYKFVLMVYPNGRNHFKGRSVSLFAHISKGNYDSRLKFPFRGKIVVQIVNWLDANKRHVEKTIEFTAKTDPEGRYGARVTGLTTILGSGNSHQGYGYHDMLCHDFLELDKVHNTQYLLNDTIIVRVIEIEEYY